MIKRKTRAVSLLLAVMLCMLLCSGCTVDYDVDDVADYINENYNLKRFSVSKAVQEVEDEEGYTDRVWVVKTMDEAELTFRVMDDYYYGMESVSNSLRDDFNDVAVSYLYEQYGGSSLLALESEEDVLTNVELVGEFKNRAELENLFDEAEKFSQYTESSPYYVSVQVEFRFENQLRHRSNSGDHDYICYGVTESEREYTMEDYLFTCLDYRLEENLSDFTEEEIKEALKDYSQCIGITRSGADGDEIEFYDDLCGSRYYYGVSFGTLYEILKREGFDVTGDSWHYSFTGVDNAVYEISYDFCDYPFEDYETGEIREGYYYLKDGEQQPMLCYFYNHFTEREIEEITGLRLVLDSMDQQ